MLEREELGAPISSIEWLERNRSLRGTSSIGRVEIPYGGDQHELAPGQ